MRRHTTTALLVIVFALVVTACGEIRPVDRNRYYIRHTVEEGDTLYSIAWRYGSDFRDVAAWNHIRPPFHIFPGEEILIIPPERFDGPRELPESRRHLADTPAAPSSAPAHRSPRPVSRPSTPPAYSNSIAWHWPTKGTVSAKFAPNDGKKGVDIEGRGGQPVFAAASGDVVYSGSGLIGYGKLIIVKHDDNYLSAYAHNRKLLVKEGDRVSAGEKIAEMGQTSKSQSILYFEIRRNGKPVDPLRYLPKTTL